MQHCIILLFVLILKHLLIYNQKSFVPIHRYNRVSAPLHSSTPTKLPLFVCLDSDVQTLLREIGRCIFASPPKTPYLNVGYSAERQYFRTILDWLAPYDHNITYVPYKRLQYDDNTTYVFSSMYHRVIKDVNKTSMKKFNSNLTKNVLLVHDSLCNRLPETNIQTGCPINTKLKPHQYFTPCGAPILHPNKTKMPSLFVDATKDWKNINSFEFLKQVHDLFSQIIIVGNIPNISSIVPSSKLILSERFPLDVYQTYMTNVWFYASGIRSSYELSLVDAQMGGATVVDVGKVAREILAPSAVRVTSLNNVRSQLSKAITNFDETRNTKYAIEHHSPEVITKHLLCALVDMKGL